MLKTLNRKIHHFALVCAPICPLPGLRMRLYRWGGLRIGSATYLNMFVSTLVDLPNNITIQIGERVAVAPGVVFAAVSGGNESRLMTTRPWKKATIVVEDDVWIGANAVILPGVTLGRMSIVGAGAVVTSDVAPGAVVVGVPAREIKRRSLDE